MQPQNNQFSSYIQQSKFALKIKNSYYSTDANFVCLCENGTFVIIDTRHIDSYSRRFTIKNVDSQGQILKQYELGIYSFAKSQMMTGQIVIIGCYCELKHAYDIIQWNIQTGQSVKVRSESLWWTQLFVFNKTKLICVIKRRNYHTQFLAQGSKLFVRISYYEFPLKSENDKPIYELIPQQIKCLGYHDTPSKLNNQSSIVWLKRLPQSYNYPKNLDYSTIHILDPKVQPFQIRAYKFPKPQYQDMVGYKWYITDVWQPKNDCLYIKCKYLLETFEYRKNLKKCIQQKEGQKILDKQRVQDYFWYYKQQQPNFHIPKFYKQNKIMQQEHIVQFSSGFRNIKQTVQEQKKLQYVCKTYHREKQVLHRVVDMYYVNEESQQIICVQRYPKKVYQFSDWHRYICPNYSDKMVVVHFCHQNDNKQVCGRIIRALQTESLSKIVTVFFLEQLVQNCDDDIIYYVLELLYNQNQGNKLDKLNWGTPQNLQNVNIHEGLFIFPNIIFPNKQQPSIFKKAFNFAINAFDKLRNK